MANLRLSLFGPFSAWLDERYLNAFESDKVRALLAYLAIEAGRPHRRSELAGLLWPDSSESAARASLRNALSNLRLVIQNRQANPQYLLCNQETIEFNLASDYWIDVHTFEDRIAAGGCEKAVYDIESQRRFLEEAVDIYQDNFLQGFSLRDSPAFEEWQLIKREHLMQQAISALGLLAEFFEQRGDYLRARDYAQRQLSFAPWHEEAHRCLMRQYAKSRQRSLALAQFELCRRRLDQELDVQPEAATIQLYEQIRDGHYERAGVVGARRHNLPAELSPLIGRIGELGEIDHKLADPSCRLLTLTAPGGSGKTRLALEVARHQLERFPDGVYIISLVPFQSVEAVITAIAHELGFSFPQASNPRSMLRDYLVEKKLLLILDSFEHVLEAAELVMDILQTAVGVKILATSRECINLQNEHIFPLRGLAFPGGIVPEVDQALCYDAVRLFLEGVQRLQPDYLSTVQDIEAIVAICQQVQGMPLAVLQAASWCTTLPIPSISIELQKNCLDFLRTDWRDLPERQRSMQAVFEYSYRLLKEEEQKVFEGLGIFQGGFSLQAAQSVVQAGLIHLRRLVDKTMLQRPDGGRFELHDLLRQFALRKLAFRPEVDHSLRERHMRFYTIALRDLAIDLQGSRQAEAVHNLLPDLPNIQMAWFWAVTHRRVDCLEMALDGLCGIYQWYGRYSDGVSACQLATSSLKIGSSEAPDEVEVCLLIRILAWQVYFAHILGQVSEPKRNLDLAFQWIEKLDSTKEEIRLVKAFLLQQAGLYYIEKHHSRGWGYWLESLALYKDLGCRWREAQVLECLATSVPQQDANRTSRAWLEESLAIRRDLGDKIGLASSLQWFSVISAAQEGDFERMGELLQESLECSQMLGNPAGQAHIQYLIAIRLTYMGKFTDALTIIKQAANQFGVLGIQDKRSQVISVQGWIETNLGDYDQGRADLEVSSEIALRLNITSIQALNLYNIGDIHAVEGSNDKAIKTLRESIDLYRQLPQRDEMGMALCELAVIEEQLGLHERAFQDLQEGFIITAQANSWQSKVSALANYARFKAEQGDLERAIDLYALAIRYPYLGNSRYWWDVAGKRIHELTAGILSEAREAAVQHGKTRDLDEAFDEIRAEILGSN